MVISKTDIRLASESLRSRLLTGCGLRYSSTIYTSAAHVCDGIVIPIQSNLSTIAEVVWHREWLVVSHGFEVKSEVRAERGVGQQVYYREMVIG